MLAAGFLIGQNRLRPRRFLERLHQARAYCLHGRVLAFARIAEVNGNVVNNLPGLSGHDQSAIAHQHRFIDIMGDDH
ncbi:MAG: hypothetical protein ACREUK_03595, partial [Burkholderiales bacterium]